MSFFNQAMKAYENQQAMADAVKIHKQIDNYRKEHGVDTETAMRELGRLHAEERDMRYNTPKGAPKAKSEDVERTIEETEIYRKAKERILNAQRKQVGYGLDKYPEPLTAGTWSIRETIEHIIDESIDKLHYLIMLSIKLEEMEREEQIENCYDELFDTYNYLKGVFEKQEMKDKIKSNNIQGIVVPPGTFKDMNLTGGIDFSNTGADLDGDNTDQVMVYADNKLINYDDPEAREDFEKQRQRMTEGYRSKNKVETPNSVRETMGFETISPEVIKEYEKIKAPELEERAKRIGVYNIHDLSADPKVEEEYINRRSELETEKESIKTEGMKVVPNTVQSTDKRPDIHINLHITPGMEHCVEDYIAMAIQEGFRRARIDE